MNKGKDRSVTDSASRRLVARNAAAITDALRRALDAFYAQGGQKDDYLEILLVVSNNYGAVGAAALCEIDLAEAFDTG